LEWVEEDESKVEGEQDHSLEGPEEFEREPGNRDKVKTATPSLPAFEFNFGFRSPEFQEDEFGFDDEDEPQQPPPRKKPLRNKQRFRPEDPVFRQGHVETTQDQPS
jgi:hypothetical protein